jgi:hypothetical protein
MCLCFGKKLEKRLINLGLFNLFFQLVFRRFQCDSHTCLFFCKACKRAYSWAPQCKWPPRKHVQLNLLWNQMQSNIVFFILTFMKSKLHNNIVIYLWLTVHWFAEHWYIMQNFFLWKMDWRMEMCFTLLLFWWLGCNEHVIWGFT